ADVNHYSQTGEIRMSTLTTTSAATKDRLFEAADAKLAAQRKKADARLKELLKPDFMAELQQAVRDAEHAVMATEYARACAAVTAAKQALQQAREDRDDEIRKLNDELVASLRQGFVERTGAMRRRILKEAFAIRAAPAPALPVNTATGAPDSAGRDE